MNLATTLQVYGGGPGSGCQGPNCGRPPAGAKEWNEISKMSTDGEDKGILTPDGRLVLGYEEHTTLRELAGYKDFDSFYDEGGVRFGVIRNRKTKEEFGFVDIAKNDNRTIGNAIKVLEKLPTNEVQFAYTSRESGKSFFVGDELPKVVAQIHKWQSKAA